MGDELLSFLYNIFINLINWAVKPFLVLSNPKFKERENEYSDSLKSLLSVDYNRKVVWIHAASMGEFEQAKPVIEKLKKKDKSLQIVVSFFSPSGYKHEKNYALAESVVYMPMDTAAKARYFIDLIRPNIAVFVRYDIWHNHLKYLKKKGIPSFLICATRPSSSILRDFPILSNFAGLNYGYFNRIYAVSKEDFHFFEDIEYQGVLKLLPDTRLDRIIEKVENAKQSGLISIPESFLKDKFVIIAGSTWQTDEEILITAYKEVRRDLKDRITLIMVPHEPTEENISRVKKSLDDSIEYSKLQELAPEASMKFKHIVVDKVGYLLTLYSVANAAFVGGGFKVGIHSVTEPAGYGIALACGKKYKNSTDAISLKEINALSIINNVEEMKAWILKIMEYDAFREDIGKKVKEYIYSSKGSSLIVAEDIINCLNNTKGRVN